MGKTTVAVTLSYLFASEGKKVLAIDADPDANLASAFGLSGAESASIKPIAEMTELIEDRMGARPGSMGGLFKLNPRVEDIPEEYGYRLDGITLLVTGRSKEAASGCYCPENVFLRRLLKHLVVDRDEAVVVDMEAGIEHLTRGTAGAVDAFLVVVEPGSRSIQTALMVGDMAKDLGVKNVFVVANKIRAEEDVAFIKERIGDMAYAGAISFDASVVDADMKGVAPYSASPALVEQIKAIKSKIMHENHG